MLISKKDKRFARKFLDKRILRLNSEWNQDRIDNGSAHRDHQVLSYLSFRSVKRQRVGNPACIIRNASNMPLQRN